MSPAAWMAGLGRASLETAALLFAVGLVVRVVPRMPAWARCALWWLASLRALIACVSLPAISLPLLPPLPSAAIPLAARASEVAARVSHTATALPRAAAPATGPLAAAASFDPGAALWFALAALWIAGMLVMVVRHARDARRVVNTWRAARAVESAATRAWFVAWLGARLAARVEIRASAEVRAPLLLGWGRPRILVPADFSADAAARMALAHEAAHLLRRDLVWGWVPALAECVFWFHPFVRWCVREYAQSREEACDAQAIELTGAEPGGYGEMLVGFGVDRARFGHAAASCGNRHVRQLTRRLQMLSHVPLQNRSQRVFAVAAVVLFAVIATLPLRVVAAPRAVVVREAARAAAEDAVTPPIQEPRADAMESLADGREPAEGTADAFAAETGRTHPHESDAKPAHETHEATHASSTESRHFFGFVSDDGGRFSYGLMDGDDGTWAGTFSDGNWAEIRRIRSRNPGRLFWFRKDGENYLVRDKATWQAVYELLEPQRRLGEQQSELGDRQSALGAEQGTLGAEQGKLGAEQAMWSGQMSRLSMKLTADLSRSRRREIEAQIDELSDRIRALGDRQTDLGARQSELGERQSELGEKQSALGEQQRVESEKARVKIRRIADECVRDGRAERWDG